MLVKCPNCKTEFFVGEKVIGECPNCKLKLLFKGENEIIEKVDIKEIERKVDEIIGEEGLSEIDLAIVDELKAEKDFEKIEEEIDKL